MSATYYLDGASGECTLEGVRTLEDFIAENEFEGEEASALRALASGETYRGGGGAAASWSLTRLS